MRISELNIFSGELGSEDYLATDNGEDTSKVSAKDIIDKAVANAKSEIIIPKNLMYYGTSTSSASASAKTVTCSGFTLFTGACIAVKFSYTSTYTGTTTLNVNSTGAKTIRTGAWVTSGTYTRVDGLWEPEQPAIFVYDGTYWRLCNPNIISTSELSTLESLLGI